MTFVSFVLTKHYFKNTSIKVSSGSHNDFSGLLFFCNFFFFRALLPVLHHKSKKGPPRQAKYAIHCIHAIFSSKETQFAQIFEVKRKNFFCFMLLLKKYE